MSDVEDEDDRSYDHRPKYIRHGGAVYRMRYYETRNMFTKNKMLMYQCQGLQPGQYSFPFSFKTFEGWPASFSHNEREKKGIIIYHIGAVIEPESPQFQLKFAREITLRETRAIDTQRREQNKDIQYCCCCNNGPCALNFHLEKDGYMPNEQVNVILEIDNSQCTSDITSVSISVDNTVTMRSQGASTNSHINVCRKTAGGLPAAERRTVLCL